MKKTLLLVIAFMFLSFQAWSGEKTLQFEWDQVISSDFAGWKLYMSETSGDYAGVVPIDIPYTGQTVYESTQTITSPDDETHTYYFVLTAYDDEVPSNESGYSNEASVTIDFEPPETPFTFIVIIVSE